MLLRDTLTDRGKSETEAWIMYTRKMLRKKEANKAKMISSKVAVTVQNY